MHDLLGDDAIVAAALREIGDGTPVRERAMVGGGSISQALRLRTARGEYLLKIGGAGLPGFFTAEARGLRLLEASGSVRVPRVLATAEVGGRSLEAGEPSLVSNTQPIAASRSYILLEWLQPPPHPDRERVGELLGTALAGMHRPSASAYGLDYDNYIGATPQPNAWQPGWLAFFRERRLGFQAELAGRNGYLRGQRAQRIERLLGRLGEWIDDSQVQPSLLHGDLWGGNVIVGPGGAPALIDPAVYYGDREADLAMTRLFGGFSFSSSFYAAYAAAWPLAPGWQERVDLYNLYHLLNHVNTFGESYGAQVDAALARYGG